MWHHINIKEQEVINLFSPFKWNQTLKWNHSIFTMERTQIPKHGVIIVNKIKSHQAFESCCIHYLFFFPLLFCLLLHRFSNCAHLFYLLIFFFTTFDGCEILKSKPQTMPILKPDPLINNGFKRHILSFLLPFLLRILSYQIILSEIYLTCVDLTCCKRSLIMRPFHAIHSLLAMSLVTNSQLVKLWTLTWLGDIQGEEDGTKTQGNFINWVVGLWVTLNFLLCLCESNR